MGSPFEEDGLLKFALSFLYACFASYALGKESSALRNRIIKVDDPPLGFFEFILS